MSRRATTRQRSCQLLRKILLADARGVTGVIQGGTGERWGIERETERDIEGHRERDREKEKERELTLSNT